MNKFSTVLVIAFAVTSMVKLAVAEETGARPDGSVQPSAANYENLGVVSSSVRAENCTAPTYPLESRLTQETGLVTVKFLLTASGAVQDRAIEVSSGYPRLDEASKTALDLCKFSIPPAQTDAASDWKRMEFLWQLSDLKLNNTCDEILYPAASVRDGESGLTILNVLVDDDGSVSDVQVDQSSDYRRLDEAAKRNVRTCKFKETNEYQVGTKHWRLVRYLWMSPDRPNRPRVFFEFGARVSAAPTRKPDWLGLLDKTFAELQAWEREKFAAPFQLVDPKDEPPFPLAGLGVFYRPILKAHREVLTAGVLSLYLTVAPNGTVTKVEVAKSPNPRISEIVVPLAMATKFKPATCLGTPCEMVFPLRVRLEGSAPK